MLILASQSPRRKELLDKLNLPFRVCVAQIDETMDPLVPPFAEVSRISYEKAMAVPREPEDIVIAADTIVVLDGQVLGKPESCEAAEDMLRRLSGYGHQVLTGITVVHGDRVLSDVEVTDVFFRPISTAEIQRYVASGEPMDKAGAYGIQGGASIFVERICGDYYNVMGLPLCRLWKMLQQIAPNITEVNP